MRSLRGYFYILGATVFWGISATVAKFLFIHQMGTLILVQMRMSLSCIVLLAAVLLFRRDLLRIKPKDLFGFALLGILGVAGSNFTYYAAIRATNVATAILLQYMAPLIVLVYAAATREETLSGVKIVAAAISLFGCFLAVGGRDVLAMNFTGILWGISSAFSWSFTTIMVKRLLRRYNMWTMSMYSFLCATVFWMIINPPWDILSAGYSTKEWGTFFVFAMISVLIPHSMYFRGTHYLTATRSIITATFEPVAAIVTAYIILGEALSPLRIVGAVVVLAAIILLQYKGESAVTEEMKDSIPLKEL